MRKQLIHITFEKIVDTENGKTKWKEMDFKDRIQTEVGGNIRKIEEDLNLEVNLEEMDLIGVEVDQMELDLSLEEMEKDLDQDQKVIW